MVKPRKITLILVAFLLLGGHGVIAQEPLTEHFVSADGTLEFDYPANWVAQDTLGSITLSNSPQVFDEQGNSVIPGTVFAVFFVQQFKDVLPPQVEQSLYSAMTHRLEQAEADGQGLDFGDVVDYPIGGYPSYHSRGASDTQDALILLLDLGAGYYGELSAVTAPGELQSFEKTLLAILATIQFEPLTPPVVAGSVVWQQTGQIGAPDAPQAFLVALAVGPDDAIYVTDGTSIFIFGADGSGPRIIREEAISGIRDLAVDREGQIWLASSSVHPLMVVDSEGTIVETWAGQPGAASPLQIEIGPDGNLYLIEELKDINEQPIAQLNVWSPDGSYLRTFPMVDPNQNRLSYAETRIAFGPDGLLYVLDGNVVRQFTPDGRVIAENIATGRLSERGNLGMTLALDAAGFLYVATEGGVILQQDNAGNYVQQFGTPQVFPQETAGDPPFMMGEFASPGGIGVLSNGDVVVADANFDFWQVVRITFAGDPT